MHDENVGARRSSMYASAEELEGYPSTVRHPSAFLAADQWASIGRALRLSPREVDISESVVDSLTEVEIGHRLGISRHTVHAHLERLYRKLGIKSRCELVVRLFAAYVSIDGRR